MKQAILLARLALAVSLVAGTCGLKIETTVQASSDDSKERQIPVDFFNVLEMPLRIADATLKATDDGYVLKCTATNYSSEQATGLHLILIIVDSNGKLRGGAGRMERVELTGHSIKELSLKLPIKFKVKTSDRVVLAVEQMFTRESIWQVLKAEEALKAYATNLPSAAPSVRRVSNQYDAYQGLLPEFR